jgi:hypothetical protein
MRGSRFTEQQIVAALRQAEGGMPVGEGCRKQCLNRRWLARRRKRSKRGGARTALSGPIGRWAACASGCPG